MLEVLIIGALALIVIGPKDLPIAMRRLGQFLGKMRAMAAEFRASFDELARQSELDELRKEVEALRVTRETFNPLAISGLESTVTEIKHHMEPISLAAPVTPEPVVEPAAIAAPEPVAEPVAPTAAPPPTAPRPKAARKSAAAGLLPKAGVKASAGAQDETP